uniref:Mitochondrial Rho GTPase 1 n=1 Tax=Schistocephalus solidus TaxID=70667 RepID=A0A0X3Q2A0_SCHSO
MARGRGLGTVRILLLGEPSVGKTTLILSLVSEEFSPQVPARADEITIPADVTPERVPTEIVDFSFRTQTQDQLVDEIRRATVICLVYSLDNENSIHPIDGRWLPLIRSCFKATEARVPVVLVGNKLDLVPSSKMEQVLPLMERYPEIETCIECSAKTMRNLSETFWFAQKAVLYPTVPLYRADTKELTPECIRALTRIFRICDIDNDGYLSDKELEAFQERCFAIPLTAQSLHDVKQLVRNSTSGGVNLHGITLKGFLFLHLVFIRKGRHETTWAVLRQFGYDNQLRLSNEFLYPKLTVPQGCSTEFSPLGLRFLHATFTKYDLDRDDCLSPSEVSELLAICPEDAQLMSAGLEELGVCVETNSMGWITRRGFMAHWALTALLEPSRALEYLAYLGFTYQTGYCYLSNNTDANRGLSGEGADMASSVAAASASYVSHAPSSQMVTSPLLTLGSVNTEGDFLLRGITVTPERRLDYIRRQTNRTVFYCRVYGARKVGKTCLLQGLLGRNIRGLDGYGIGGMAHRTSNWAAATGIPVYGQPRTLVLHEINATNGEQMSAAEALSADVACLVYDVTDPESFRYIANLYLNFYRGTRVPCLFVSAKSDQPQVLQNFRLDPQEMANKYRLPDPEPFSSFDVRPRAATGLFAEPHRFRRSSADTASRRPASDSRDSRTTWYLDGANTLGPDEDLTVVSADAEPLPSTFWPPSQSSSASLPTDHPGRPLRSIPREARSSTPLMFGSGRPKVSMPGVDKESCCDDFHPVYIKLASMANYPHLRHMELANPDYAWKLTLAATILAGLGFVAFRIAKPHF